MIIGSWQILRIVDIPGLIGNKELWLLNLFAALAPDQIAHIG